MSDNKIRLSPDVLEKAERIAAEWGLKNARAAVEAVFRQYCDHYLESRPQTATPFRGPQSDHRSAPYGQAVPPYSSPPGLTNLPPCDAIDAIDQLLAL